MLVVWKKRYWVYLLLFFRFTQRFTKHKVWNNFQESPLLWERKRGEEPYGYICDLFLRFGINLKNMKDTHGGVFFLLKFQASAPTLLKVMLLHRVFFSRFLNCTKGTKSCRVSLIFFFFFPKTGWRKATQLLNFHQVKKMVF